MPYLKINSSRLKMHIEFKDKYAIIEGDSGVGKTLMVELLSDEESGKLVETDLKIHILNKVTQNDYANWNDGLIVSDEIYARKFCDSFKDKNCYFLIVSRKLFKNMNFSNGSFYKAYREYDITRFKKRSI